MSVFSRSGHVSTLLPASPRRGSLSKRFKLLSKNVQETHFVSKVINISRSKGNTESSSSYRYTYKWWLFQVSLGRVEASKHRELQHVNKKNLTEQRWSRSVFDGARRQGTPSSTRLLVLSHLCSFSSTRGPFALLALASIVLQLARAIKFSFENQISMQKCKHFQWFQSISYY